MTVDEYEKRLRRMVMAKKTGSVKTMGALIRSGASAWRALEVANMDIDGLASTTVETPQGLKAHPAFRVRKEAEDSLMKHLKALGLTAADIDEVSETAPIEKLTSDLVEVSKTKKIIKPTND